MKHIKLYEDHNNYYQEIESDEYDRLTLGHCDEDLYNTMDELNFVSKNWADFTKSEISQIMAYFPVGYTHQISIEGMLEILQHGKFQIGIIKLKDEWYFLTGEKENINNTEIDFYKCDQFEGLKKLLKDKFLGVNENRKRTALYLNTEMERDKLEDLSEYLQEIFDKYHIPQLSGNVGYFNRYWSIANSHILGASHIEILVESEIFRKVLSDIDKITPLLERRLSSKIRTVGHDPALFGAPNRRISIYVLKGEDPWKKAYRPLKKARKPQKKQNIYKKR